MPKISELTDQPSPSGSDYIPVVSGGETMRANLSTLPIPAAVQTALDTKLDESLVSAFGLTLVDDANAAAGRTTLGAAASGANSDITSLSAVTSYNGGQLAGLRNKIINGKMDIAQRGTSFASASGYTLDRWYFASTSIVTVTQNSSVPSANEFVSSLRAEVTTPDGSIGAADFSRIVQSIEGYNARDLIGRTLTLSFWVRSAKTGTHCVAFRNSSSDRSYIAEYTISAIDTWEKKTITLSGGLITAGTWNWTTGVGLEISFALTCGTTFHTTAGAWQSGNYLATASQVNVFDTIGNAFGLTGVQLEVGSVATEFEHRSIGLELALCQRYFQNLSGDSAGYTTTTMSINYRVPYPVPMRTTPTISAAGSNTNTSGATITAHNASFYNVSATGTSPGGYIYSVTATATAEL